MWSFVMNYSRAHHFAAFSAVAINRAVPWKHPQAGCSRHGFFPLLTAPGWARPSKWSIRDSETDDQTGKEEVQNVSRLKSAKSSNRSGVSARKNLRRRGCHGMKKQFTTGKQPINRQIHEPKRKLLPQQTQKLGTERWSRSSGRTGEPEERQAASIIIATSVKAPEDKRIVARPAGHAGHAGRR